MNLKIFKSDFKKNRVIMVSLSLLITIASLLLSVGSRMLIDLSSSINRLIEKSNAPHFVQYHAGNVNETKMLEWINENELVKDYQLEKMINIGGSNIYFNGLVVGDSVMENGFTSQNERFDLMLDLSNNIISLNDGEIAVPIYYKQNNDLDIGDTVIIEIDDFSEQFVVTAFVRDVQMNPSIVSSKRFILSDNDFDKLENTGEVIEYLIAFQVNELDQIDRFVSDYTLSEMPNKGPAIDYNIIVMANLITDGLVTGILIFVSLTLILITFLSLRYTIISSIEDDYREIGVMKAIGIDLKNIRRIYLVKYLTISSISIFIGFLLSFFMYSFFSNNILLYFGSTNSLIVTTVIPFISASIIFLTILLFCYRVLSRFKKISAVNAIRMESSGFKTGRILKLHRNSIFESNIFLGIKEILSNSAKYIILLIVFIVSTFIIIVPQNLSTTIQSDNFINYLGMGRSDILIDIRHNENIQNTFNVMYNEIGNDPEVEKIAALITCQYEYQNLEGYNELLTIETGDISTFPIEYYEGVAPSNSNEIALSILVAQSIEKSVGDTMQLIIEGEIKSLTISGIYQDLSNGGRTAKAPIPPNHETALWYVIKVNVTAETDEKIKQYNERFSDAKITDINGYISKTFGTTIKQLKLLTYASLIIAILLMILLTSLFLKMVIAKEISQIAIMKSIGVSTKSIKKQFMTRSIILLVSGIVLGTIAANTIGEKMFGIILSFLGASQISFEISPLVTYLLFPMVMITAVCITTLVSLKHINKIDFSKISVE